MSRTLIAVLGAMLALTACGDDENGCDALCDKFEACGFEMSGNCVGACEMMGWEEQAEDAAKRSCEELGDGFFDFTPGPEEEGDDPQSPAPFDPPFVD